MVLEIACEFIDAFLNTIVFIGSTIDPVFMRRSCFDE